MTEDIRVVVGGDAKPLNAALAESQRIVAGARAQVQRELDALDRKVGDSQKQLGGLSRGFGEMRAALQPVLPVLGAFGIGLGAAQLVQFGRHVIDTVGGLGELAEQLGVGTEALQVYQFAAVQAGAKPEQLEAGLAKLARTVGEAAEGNEAAIRTFNRLGVGVLDAAGNLRSTDAVLQDVARRVMAIEDPARRASAAVELFGRAGQRLLPFLAKLAQGYDRMRDGAREAGAVVDDELIERFNRASNSLAIFGKRVVVFAADLIGAFVPATRDAGSAIAELEERLKSLRQQRDAGMPKGVLDPMIASTEQQLARLRARAAAPPPAGPGMEWAGAPAAAGDTSNPVSDAERRRNLDAASAFERMESEMLREHLDRMQKIRVTAAEKALEADEITRQETAEAQAIVDRQAEKRAREQNAVAALDAQAEAAGRGRVAWNEFTQAYEVHDRELKIVVETQRLLNAELGIGEEKAREMAEANVAAQERLRETTQRVQAEARRANEAWDEITRFGERAFDRIGAAITEMFVQGRGAAFEWRNIVLGIVSELGQEFMKLAVMNPLKNMLFGGNAATLGGFFDLFGPAAAGTSLTAASAGVGLPFAFAAGGVMTGRGPLPLRRYAGGGVADTPQLALFGEGRVPEAYVPLPDGRSIPVTMSSDGAGAPGGNNFFIDAKNADRQGLLELRALLMDLAGPGRVETRSLAAVMDARRRGGRFAQAFGL